jgi:outer membrane protein TolC
VGVAAADLYPKITLSAQPAMVSTALSTLLDWGSRNYAVSAGLLWPIFEGGKLRARLAQANARQQEALLAYRKTVLVALKDVEDALARYQADEARRGSLQASLESARAAETLARDRYEAGLNPYSDVLAAREASIAGEDALAQAEAARATDAVTLYAALGGGWSETDLKESAP